MDNTDYAYYNSVSDCTYAVAMIFAGRLIDWLGNEDRLYAYGL